MYFFQLNYFYGSRKRIFHVFWEPSFKRDINSSVYCLTLSQYVNDIEFGYLILKVLLN